MSSHEQCRRRRAGGTTRDCRGGRGGGDGQGSTIGKQKWLVEEKKGKKKIQTMWGIVHSLASSHNELQ